MTFLLDISVIRELARPEPNAAVRAWFEAIPTASLHLSHVTLGEVAETVERLRPASPARAASLQAWLRLLRRHYADRLLPITVAVVERWGRLRAKTSRPAAELLLAATALENDLTLVTGRTGELAATGVRLLDPWQAQPSASVE